MFDAFELQQTAPTIKRFTGAVTAALAVMAAGLVLLAVLSSQRVAEAIKPKQVDVSFRPPPPPPAPVKIENAPPPPPKVVAPKPPPSIAELPPPVAAPAAPPPPAAAAMVAPREVPKVAAPESDTSVQAVALAVGGTGDGSGTAVGSAPDDSPAPVVASATGHGPVNLPEDADPPEPRESNVAPEYPEVARTSGQEARVVLKIVVERDGHVGRVQVLKGDEPFVAAALAAVRSWAYEPARLEGEAIAVFKIVDLTFKLRSE